jgi:hypothetical protein
MERRALQLILPFEPGLPDRSLILAPRLWPTMTPRARQQLAKRVAHLLRPSRIGVKGRLIAEYAAATGAERLFAQYQCGWLGLGSYGGNDGEKRLHNGTTSGGCWRPPKTGEQRPP